LILEEVHGTPEKGYAGPVRRPGTGRSTTPCGQRSNPGEEAASPIAVVEAASLLRSCQESLTDSPYRFLTPFRPFETVPQEGDPVAGGSCSRMSRQNSGIPR
jgi:hypothetical protein